jgi:NADH-quinone oxidoreductase subunit F
VVDKNCPHCNGKKKVLAIDPAKCKGCTKCKRNCPMDAITGEVKQVHVIDTEKCIKCGACVSGCPFGAIAEV